MKNAASMNLPAATRTRSIDRDRAASARTAQTLAPTVAHLGRLAAIVSGLTLPAAAMAIDVGV